MTRKETSLQQFEQLEFPFMKEGNSENETVDIALYRKTAVALIRCLDIQSGKELGIFIGTGLEESEQEAVVSWLQFNWPGMTNRNVKHQFGRIRNDLAKTLDGISE